MVNTVLSLKGAKKPTVALFCATVGFFLQKYFIFFRKRPGSPLLDKPLNARKAAHGGIDLNAGGDQAQKAEGHYLETDKKRCIGCFG